MIGSVLSFCNFPLRDLEVLGESDRWQMENCGVPAEVCPSQKNKSRLRRVWCGGVVCCVLWCVVLLENEMPLTALLIMMLPCCLFAAAALQLHITSKLVDKHRLPAMWNNRRVRDYID